MKLFNLVAAVALVGGLVLGGMTVLPGTQGTAMAQEASASHLAAARKAINASKSTEQLDLILPRQAETMKAELIRNRPDAEAQINIIVDETAISLAPRRGDLEAEAAQIFVRNFTEEELNQIADFFGSDAGQKFLDLSPLVLREIQRAAQVWTNGINRDMSEQVLQKLQEAGLR